MMLGDMIGIIALRFASRWLVVAGATLGKYMLTATSVNRGSTNCTGSLMTVDPAGMVTEFAP
jgi:hypothetical protein